MLFLFFGQCFKTAP